MKNQRLNTRKKRGTKIWITLAVLFTILIGASLGALSAYNWSVDKAIQGLFYSSSNEPDKAAEEPADENNPANEPDDGNAEEEPPAENPPEPSDDELKEETPPVKEEEPLTPETVKEPTYVQGVLIANKEYPLPDDFAPGEDEEAKAAYMEMEKAAALEGFELVAFSTYRSYEYQDELYHRYVDEHGQEEADRFSAQPGYSEHQTGLGFDIGEVGQEAQWADDSFKDTEAAKWLADNAHHFGFILRYPPGKEDITGYQYESWHFRYLGEDLAVKVHNSGLTLEEYLNM
ncbi:D-alanyl-D-alanine carboxypeptidase family protein [Jeotgalibacillus sp. S-D1]|uniref:M15 family metallopeptidase n=1 Tax=Jeotgalibacillus sp. S-D1 TaxID=2552189 RepID=UPI00105A1D46|nr:M15 family metallopeptidase [Jeotgalibacillus sp. S-D1]TDL30466.1 D-alanyl-D-alanine carboxypeptidase family protein [Jeotgalibacillus sp. S-D1]